LRHPCPGSQIRRSPSLIEQSAPLRIRRRSAVIRRARTRPPTSLSTPCGEGHTTRGPRKPQTFPSRTLGGTKQRPNPGKSMPRVLARGNGWRSLTGPALRFGSLQAICSHRVRKLVARLPMTVASEVKQRCPSEIAEHHTWRPAFSSCRTLVENVHWVPEASRRDMWLLQFRKTGPSGPRRPRGACRARWVWTVDLLQPAVIQVERGEPSHSKELRRTSGPPGQRSSLGRLASVDEHPRGWGRI
jgi:hypothetical protein